MPASSTTETYTPKQQYGGESDIVSTSGTFASGNSLVRLEVIARVTATSQLVPWNPAGADGSQTVVGITAEAVDASAAAADGPYYIGGVFNPDELTWPAAATEAQKASAFDRTNISLRTPKYST